MRNSFPSKTVIAIAALVAATAISTTAASANSLNPFEALFGPLAAAGHRPGLCQSER